MEHNISRGFEIAYLPLRQVVSEPKLSAKFLMARDDIGGNRSTDEDQRIRAIAIGVVTAAINNIRPLLDRVPLMQAQLEEVLQRLEALSPNGNKEIDQRRGGADETTRGLTSLTHNPVNTPQIQNLQELPVIPTQNPLVIESDDRAPRRT